MKNYVFTSESVSCGHPDKICDQISDAILDEFIKQDKDSKVAVECFITNNMLVIGGEAHSRADVDIIGTAKKILDEIGYDGTNGFDPESAVFINTIHEQSSDIRMGVNENMGIDMGAGDQGIMFGYACNETKEYMPATLVLANETMRVYDELRKAGELPGMEPDAKCQYTLEYDVETNKPVKIQTILISMQHDENISETTLKRYFLEKIFPIVKSRHHDLNNLFIEDFHIMVNPTGRFVIGGPEGDTGLTGRKIIVDTYGGRCAHGGGAFSGKDPSKVDRSAAYAARYIAKTIVAAGLASEAVVQLSYAIGYSMPISVYVKMENSEYSDKFIADCVEKYFPLTPYEIIDFFQLKMPIYSNTATYGHFGKGFSWELLDDVENFKQYVEKNSNEMEDDASPKFGM